MRITISFEKEKKPYNDGYYENRTRELEMTNRALLNRLEAYKREYQKRLDEANLLKIKYETSPSKIMEDDLYRYIGYNNQNIAKIKEKDQRIENLEKEIEALKIELSNQTIKENIMSNREFKRDLIKRKEEINAITN